MDGFFQHPTSSPPSWVCRFRGVTVTPGGRDSYAGGVTVAPGDGELLQFLSPLGWEHINLTGDYVWRQSRRLEDGKFRPLRMPGKP